MMCRDNGWVNEGRNRSVQLTFGSFSPVKVTYDVGNNKVLDIVPTWKPLTLPPNPYQGKPVWIWRNGRRAYKIYLDYPDLKDSDYPILPTGWDDDTTGTIGAMSSASSIKSSRHEKKKQKVLPEHYVSQKAIDDLCRRAKTVQPTLNDFQVELKTLKQYTRTLDSRLSSVEAQLTRAQKRSSGGIGAAEK